MANINYESCWSVEQSSYRELHIQTGTSVGGTQTSAARAPADAFTPIAHVQYKVEVTASGTGELRVRGNDANYPEGSGAGTRTIVAMTAVPQTAEHTWTQNANGGNLVLSAVNSVINISSIVIYRTDSHTKVWELDFSRLALNGAEGTTDNVRALGNRTQGEEYRPGVRRQTSDGNSIQMKRPVTQKLKMELLSQDDLYNVDDFNANFKKIDAGSLLTIVSSTENINIDNLRGIGEWRFLSAGRYTTVGRRDGSYPANTRTGFVVKVFPLSSHMYTGFQTVLQKAFVPIDDMGGDYAEYNRVSFNGANSGWTEWKLSTADLTAHTGNRNNPHGVTAAQVGLGNVNNTSDANKPISNAVQNALNGKANTSDLTSHTGNTNNPHNVTVVQVGAEPARTLVTQSEAETGTSTTVRSWTPQRVRQAAQAAPRYRTTSGLVTLFSGSFLANNYQYFTTPEPWINFDFLVFNVSRNAAYSATGPQLIPVSLLRSWNLTWYTNDNYDIRLSSNGNTQLSISSSTMTSGTIYSARIYGFRAI